MMQKGIGLDFKDRQVLKKGPLGLKACFYRRFCLAASALEGLKIMLSNNALSAFLKQISIEVGKNWRYQSLQT